MACAFGLPELASHNAFIKDWRKRDTRSISSAAYLVFYGLPYLDKDGGLKHGDWVSPVDLQMAP